MIFQRLKKVSGIHRLHPHLFRHTFATRYIQSGGNALALKALLGHSSLKMVDRYVHFAAMEVVRASQGLSLLDRISSGEPLANNMAPVNSRERSPLAGCRSLRRQGLRNPLSHQNIVQRIAKGDR